MPRLTMLGSGMRSRLKKLAQDASGLAVIEFAYVIPFFAVLLGVGVELTNYSITHTRVSQIAVSLADNASRAKQDVVSGIPRMREVDVNEVFLAAQLQSAGLDIETNGRLVLSSLEVNGDGGQWIHWQRCYGEADYASSYGAEGDGDTGTSMTGMGPSDRKVAAEEGYAIMFVEVVYDYDPVMFGSYFGDGPIRKTAAMYVRDQRDLSGIYNPSPAGDIQSCVTSQ
ncbi:MAG: pilus assembly protein [Sphingomonadaceae bacterium]|nr:pilus assembly protein [Sphingomonadaceae bacterium]